MTENKHAIELMSRAYQFRKYSIELSEARNLTPLFIRMGMIRDWIAKVGTGFVKLGSWLEQFAMREEPIPTGTDGVHPLRTAS
jgi:hypothetical protein